MFLFADNSKDHLKLLQYVCILERYSNGEKGMQKLCISYSCCVQMMFVFLFSFWQNLWSVGQVGGNPIFNVHGIKSNINAEEHFMQFISSECKIVSSPAMREHALRKMKITAMLGLGQKQKKDCLQAKCSMAIKKRKQLCSKQRVLLRHPYWVGKTRLYQPKSAPFGTLFTFRKGIEVGYSKREHTQNFHYH